LVTIDVESSVSLGSAFSQNYSLKQYAMTGEFSVGALLSTTNFTNGGTQYQTLTFQVTGGALAFEVDTRAQGSVSGNHEYVNMTLNIWCNGAVPGNAGTCTPDPATQAQLKLILDLLRIIQRQHVPFAYVDSTVHSGLRGSGEIAVSGLIGARITITDSLPGAIGVEAGDPETVFSSSWVNWGVAGAWTPRERLTTTTTLSLPATAGVYTTLGYSLADGVEVTVTELVRES
jgi:hypothetical protein